MLSNLLYHRRTFPLSTRPRLRFLSQSTNTAKKKEDMARPCRTLSSPSTGGSPREKQKAVQGRVLYVLLLVLNILLIALFYFGIWRFFCNKKKQQVVDDDTNSATTSSSSTPNSPSIYSRNGRLDSRVLSSLPIFVNSNGSEAKTECAVCLMEFKEGETGRLLPSCNHGFHPECVDMWLQSHSTCPLCRASIEAGDSDSTATV